MFKQQTFSRIKIGKAIGMYLHILHVVTNAQRYHQPPVRAFIAVDVEASGWWEALIKMQRP